MNGIVNGSILKFKSEVIIPATGLAFAKLKFIDNLSDGLEFIASSAKVEYVTPPTATTYSTTTNFVPNYDTTLNDLTLTITDTAIVAPTADTKVIVSFSVKVTDVSRAVVANILSNTYQFSMLKTDDTVIGTPVGDTIQVNISQYPLYLMGVPTKVNKEAGKTLNAIYFFGAASGYENNNLVYNIEVQPSSGFTFPTDTALVKVTMDSITGTVVPGSSVTIDPLTGIISATFPHSDVIREKFIFVTVPVTTNADVLTLTSPALIHADAKLSGTGGIVLSDSPETTVLITLIENVPPKSLTGNSKSLIS